MRRASIIFFLMMVFKVAFGVPAYPYLVEVLQPDGSRILVYVRGDERFRYRMNIMGDVIQKDKEGFYRPTFMSPLSSGSVAPVLSVSSVSGGKISALVIPVEFKDVEFTVESPREHFDKMLNQKGYSEYNSTGSAKEYFEDNLMGKRVPVFEVSDVVKLSNVLEYYGANNTGSQRGSVTNLDIRVEEMMREACAALDSEVDFSKFDYVFIYFAGYSEAEGGDENSIWPVSLDISSNPITFDGARITSIGCGSELRGVSGISPSGIGTFCHEFGHILGLPDLYDVDYQEGGQSKGMWGTLSVMDYGCYNNQGKTPPYFNAIEREILGVEGRYMSRNVSYVLEPVHLNEGFYRIDTQNEGEYYLIETRTETGWDSYIGGEGMLVYHIDKSRNPSGEIISSVRWDQNVINAFSEHECADLVEAIPTAVNVRQVFFPGLGNVTAFGVLTDPHFVDWSMRGTGVKLEDITFISETRGVSFTSRYDEDEILMTPQNIKIKADQKEAFIRWEKDFNMEGRWGLRWKESKSSEFKAKDEVIVLDEEYLLTNLKGGTAYECELFHIGYKNNGDTVSFHFKSDDITSPYPYIHGLGPVLSVGDTLRLSVYNLTEVEDEIRWFFDGNRVMDGLFVLDRVGQHTISVKITYVSDGSVETISRDVMINEKREDQDDE